MYKNTYTRSRERHSAEGEKEGKAMETKAVLEVPPTTTRTYVVFTVRGGNSPYVDMDTRKPVDSRDPQRDAKTTNHPCDDVVAFRYYDADVSYKLVDGKPVETVGDPRNYSKLYIVDGELMDTNAVAALGNRDGLVVDMDREDLHRVVRYYYGGFMTEAYDPSKHELVSSR